MKHLTVIFSLQADFYGDCFRDMWNTDKEDNDRETTERQMHRDAIVTLRVAELFLESGLLTPLSQLSNVENFTLKYLPPDSLIHV